jgi:hypothetical protein
MHPPLAPGAARAPRAASCRRGRAATGSCGMLPRVFLALALIVVGTSGQETCTDFTQINLNCPNHALGSAVPSTCVDDPTHSYDDQCAQVFTTWYQRCFVAVRNDPGMRTIVQQFGPQLTAFNMLCTAQLSPSTRPPPPPSPPAPAFAVSSGPCTVQNNGQCVGRPSGYGQNERCTITVLAPVTLGSCPVFDTESGYDRVTIDGTDYDGTHCPQGVSVASGSSIIWDSDGSVVGSGWEICSTASGGSIVPPPPPSTDPCVANPCNDDGQVMTCEKCPYRPLTGMSGSDGTDDHGMTAKDWAGMVHCRLGNDFNNCPAAGVLPSYALSWPSGTGLGPEMKCWQYGSSYYYNIPTSSPCVHGPSTPSTGGGH